MFNILLILAGVLEYVLLGINFHVRLRVLAFDKLFDWLSQPVIPPLPSLQENFQNTYLGGILIAVAFLNAFIEFYQVQKSEAILASFLAMIPPSCRVVRDSTLLTVPAEDLVKGDVVLVVRGTCCNYTICCGDIYRIYFYSLQRMGDKTPADMVLFSASDCKVDNSSLTGESEPQERLPLPDGSKARVVEAENLACLWVVAARKLCSLNVLSFRFSTQLSL